MLPKSVTVMGSNIGKAALQMLRPNPSTGPRKISQPLEKTAQFINVQRSVESWKRDERPAERKPRPYHGVVALSAFACRGTPGRHRPAVNLFAGIHSMSEVRPSLNKGLGVFAAAAIPYGTTIMLDPLTLKYTKTRNLRRFTVNSRLSPQ